MAGAGASASTMADAFRFASAPASPAPCASSCAWTGSPVVVARVFWSGSGQPGRRRWSKFASRLTFLSSGGGLVRNECLEGGSSLGCVRAFGLGYSGTPPRFARHNVSASSADFGSGGYREGNEVDVSADDEKPVPQTAPQVIQSSVGDRKQSLQAVGALSTLIVVGLVAAVVATLSSGGPAALVAAIAKSGFSAAFALIFVSEIGDKTFFIAALLAMRHSRGLVLLGASTALGLMTVISVLIGRLCQRVPQQLQTTLPVGEYAAVALLIWFGLRSIKSAYDLPSAPSTSRGNQGTECGELAEAEEFLKKSEGEKKISTPLEVLVEAFSLVFLAEWGDRSMLATVALGAAQSPWGVASGAIAGHVLATALAVVGGAFLAEHISEKVVGYIGGVLFLIFAAATLLGVF